MPRPKKETPSMKDVFEKETQEVVENKETHEVVEKKEAVQGDLIDNKVTLPSGFEVSKGSYESFISRIESEAKSQVQLFTPVGYMGDKPVYDMANYVESEKIAAKAREFGANVGNYVTLVDYDDKGFLTSTPRDKYVVIESIEFANRLRRNTDKKTISIVFDYLPVSEHSSGRISQTTITSYEIGKVDGKLSVLGIENVTSHDFVQEFIDELQGDHAKLAKELVTHYSKRGTNDNLDLDSLFD